MSCESVPKAADWTFDVWVLGIWGGRQDLNHLDSSKDEQSCCLWRETVHPFFLIPSGSGILSSVKKSPHTVWNQSTFPSSRPPRGTSCENRCRERKTEKTYKKDDSALFCTDVFHLLSSALFPAFRLPYLLCPDSCRRGEKSAVCLSFLISDKKKT